ncbi:MAG: DUF1127 domain-containing protein [Amaricoccus sp.]|uniref:DUF1127 domain-containing protein n=1 Tax=Amaricoccus sp. TaxID=1872485 RepID=UPI0039E50FD3
MSALTTTRNVRTDRPRLSVRGLLKAILDLDARYRSRQDLAELDARMLRDMGLTRADVAAELRRPLL